MKPRAAKRSLRGVLRQAIQDVERERVTAEAVRAVSRYMETWNTRDPAVWARSLHFPTCGRGWGGSA